MIRVLVLALILCSMAAAQAVSGSTSPAAGQTASASFTPVPNPLWTMAIACTQVAPFEPMGVTKGTAFNCTLTSNLVAPIGGSFTFTFLAQSVWQITPASGVACLVNTACALTIGPGALSTTFSLLGF